MKGEEEGGGGASNWPPLPQKKLPLKSPVLLGLICQNKALWKAEEIVSKSSIVSREAAGYTEIKT